MGAMIAGLNAPPAPFVPEQYHFRAGYALIVAAFGADAEHARLAGRARPCRRCSSSSPRSRTPRCSQPVVFTPQVLLDLVPDKDMSPVSSEVSSTFLWQTHGKVSSGVNCQQRGEFSGLD
jgi:hypothetical protein